MLVTVEAYASPPRVRVDTTGSTVWRIQGTARTQVRGLTVGGVIYDYECPQETPVTYAVVEAGVTVTSALVELPDCGEWLVHLSDPSRSQQVVIREHPEWTQPALRDVVDIPASSAAGTGRTVVVSFGRVSKRGDLTLNTYTVDDEAGLSALLADGSHLFLSTPQETGFGPAYVSLGDARWSRRINFTGDKGRVVTVPYVEIERPDIIIDTALTWAQLPGSWSSLSSTWDSLERG